MHVIGTPFGITKEKETEKHKYTIDKFNIINGYGSSHEKWLIFTILFLISMSA